MHKKPRRAMDWGGGRTAQNVSKNSKMEICMWVIKFYLTFLILMKEHHIFKKKKKKGWTDRIWPYKFLLEGNLHTFLELHTAQSMKSPQQPANKASYWKAEQALKFGLEPGGRLFLRALNTRTCHVSCHHVCSSEFEIQTQHFEENRSFQVLRWISFWSEEGRSKHKKTHGEK